MASRHPLSESREDKVNPPGAYMYAPDIVDRTAVRVVLDLVPDSGSALPITMIEAIDICSAVYVVSDGFGHVAGKEFKVDVGITIR